MQGKGPSTFTSGFEGACTVESTTWTNQYFPNLFDFHWNLIPGNPPWAPDTKDRSEEKDIIMMRTSDITLTKDPGFLEILQGFGIDINTVKRVQACLV